MRSQSIIRSLAVASLAQVFIDLVSALPIADNTSAKHLRRTETQSDSEKTTQKTWMIVGGSLVGGAIFCTIIWMFFRRNLIPSCLIPSRILARNTPKAPSITSPLHSTTTTITSSASAFKSYRRGVKTPPFTTVHERSPSEDRSSLLYGNGASTASYSFHKPPQPILARSDDELNRANTSRRYLIREDLLTSKSQQNSHTFFDDSASHNTDRRNHYTPSQASIVLPLQKPLPLITKSPEGFGQYVPPPIPPSPTTSERNARFSWMSAKSGKTNRTSVESEPPRFRGLEEWVGNQAVRVEKGKVKGLVREKPGSPDRARIALEDRVMSAGSPPRTPWGTGEKAGWVPEEEKRGKEEKGRRRDTQESLF